jgi:hypothetical protein
MGLLNEIWIDGMTGGIGRSFMRGSIRGVRKYQTFKARLGVPL